jgi:hypothetical protein
MNSFGMNDKMVMGLIVFAGCVLIGGSFWGGFHIARRMVENPIGLTLLTLLFGSIILVVVAGGLVAGCMGLAVTPMFA